MFGECRISYPNGGARVQFCAHRDNPLNSRRGRILLTISGEVDVIRSHMTAMAIEMEGGDANEAAVHMAVACGADERVVVAVTPSLKKHLERVAT